MNKVQNVGFAVEINPCSFLKSIFLFSSRLNCFLLFIMLMIFLPAHCHLHREMLFSGLWLVTIHLYNLAFYTLIPLKNLCFVVGKNQIIPHPLDMEYLCLICSRHIWSLKRAWRTQNVPATVAKTIHKHVQADGETSLLRTPLVKYGTQFWVSVIDDRTKRSVTQL